ncbi:MAG: hypothetical protein Q9162_006243 [Coniocarpon cinnabarinum]
MAAADEPRRSGRATKGQHTKNVEEPTTATAAPPTLKGKGRGKRQQTQEEVQEDEDEEEEQIRCLCGTGEDDDDGGRAFTCCDKCNVWQHNDCMGLPIRNFKPEEYYCEQCKPENHPRTIEALRNGQAPDEIAAQNREEAHSRKKSGRKSKGPRPSETKEETTAVPATPDPNTRKHARSETPGTQPSKLRKSSTHATEDVAAAAKGERAQALEGVKLANSLSDIKNTGRHATATALKKKFGEAIRKRSSKGEYRVPDGHTPDSLGEQQALVVEYAMHMNLCGNATDPTPAYKEQFRNITSNIGQNAVLVFDLIDGKLTADALSTMSSSDMASDEQKKRDKEIKEENDRLAMLKEEDESGKRRIRKTHKGDEYIDDEPMGTSDPTAPAPPPPRRISSDAAAASPGAEQPRAPRLSTDRSTLGAQRPTFSPGAPRRSSSNFNVQNVWSSVQSPTGEAQPSFRYRGQPQSDSQARPLSHQNDADIDRLLGDDEGPDSAPYSPTDAGADSSIIWRGKVDMPATSQSVACFDARAVHVAGSNLENRDRMVAIFPPEIIMAGRISAEKADEYLNSLSAASRTDVTVLDLLPPNDDAKSQSEFNSLFDYLVKRERYGVVKEPHNAPVRDAYVIPLETGTAPKPTFLHRLAQNVIEDDRSRRMLLIVFVLRYRSPAPSAQATPTAVQAPMSAMSPTAPGVAMPANHTAPIRAPSQPGPSNTMSPYPPVNGQLPPQQQYQQPPFPPQQPQGPPSLPENPYTPSSVPQPLPYASPQAQYQLPPLIGPPPSSGTYPPPLSQPPQQQPLSPNIINMAKSILGHYYDCPTAQQVLQSSNGAVTVDILQNLKRVFENHPESHTNFDAFRRALDSGS